jgi:mycothiol synthase
MTLNQDTLTDETLTQETLTFALRPVVPTDLKAVVELINACADAQEGNGRTSVEEVQEEWALLDLEQSARVAVLPDGRVAGYIEAWDIDPLPVSNWVWGRVHPDFEGRGIGTALMEWVDERLQETAGRVPDDLQVVYHCGTLSAHEPSKQLMEDRGLALQRHFWRMVIDFDGAPPEPVWPEGLHVSTYAAEDDLLAVFRAQEEAFRDHWGFVEQPEEEAFAEWQKWTVAREKHDSALWFLAMDGDEIAGVCLCRRDFSEDADMGWVGTLAVREGWRQRGLGLALLQHAFGVLYREGKLRVGLGVDAASLTGATRLYEKAGMYVARRYDDYEQVVRPGRDIARRN